MGEKPKRPRPAKRRTLPPDSVSLEAMIRTLERELHEATEHWKREPHDGRARNRVQILHDDRAKAYAALRGMDSVRWQQLMGEFSHPELHEARP